MEVEADVEFIHEITQSCNPRGLFGHLWWVLQARESKIKDKKFLNTIKVEPTTDGERRRFVCTDGKRIHICETSATWLPGTDSGTYGVKTVTRTRIQLVSTDELFPNYQRTIPALGTERAFQADMPAKAKDLTDWASIVSARYAIAHGDACLRAPHVADLGVSWWSTNVQRKWMCRWNPERALEAVVFTSNHTFDGGRTKLTAVTMPLPLDKV